MSEETKQDVAVEIPAKFKTLIETVEKMNVLELNELVKVLEKKFGVSAAAVAVAAPGAAAASAGVIFPILEVLITLPVLSPVSVFSPNFISISYSFSQPLISSKRLVALPIKINKTPVAKGSSVPPCPTFTLSEVE